MRKVLLALLVLLVPMASQGQSAEDCVQITNDAYRLACFDNLFGNGSGATSQQASGRTSQSSGVWDVGVDVNPLDDTQRVVLFNSSAEGQNSLGDPILLAIRCISGRTDVLIDWGEYLGFDARPSVRYRVGREDAVSSMWNKSSDEEATFFPGNSVSLIMRMVAVDETATDGAFVAQVTPTGESAITAVWNLYGLAEAVEPMREACGW
ncbi:MAG: type VI secretion system-associated protein TagO [Gammaproteobacteria bacterium]|nr:type VI secretion system-associated protein TagO [Gammaproteobacteria bacterium]